MDWNNDGNMDLIVGEYGVKTGTATGKVHYFERNSDGTLKPSVHLECNGEEITARYTAPEVVDWNNDGLLDLIVGYVDGLDGEKAPYLFINDGTKENYHFSIKEILKDKNGTKLADFAYGRVHVKVTDLNNDGKKDLVMGGWGPNSPGEKFYYYENVGSDAAPDLNPKVEVLKNDGDPLVTSGTHKNQRFAFWDWNGDGYEDLIWADYKVSKDEGLAYTNPLFISYSSTNGVIDTEEPTVNVLSPSTGDTLKVADVIDISWSASDNVGVDSCEVYVSIVKNTWQLVGKTDGKTNSISWEVPDTLSNECKFKVLAIDSSQNVGTGSSGECIIVKGTGVLTNHHDKRAFSLIRQGIYLNFSLPQKQKGYVEIVSADGTVVQKMNPQMYQQSGNRLTLDATIAAGVYFFRFNSNHTSYRSKIVLTQ